MQGLIRCGVIAGMLLGCGPGGIGPQDDTPVDDAPIGPHGLILEWSSSPSDILSEVNGVTLKEARFALDTLRVVGDAGPGDLRTTKMGLDLRWNKDVEPGDVTFDNAPTGLYSQVALDFDGGTNESFRIEGTVVINSNTEAFKLESDNPVTFNIPIDVMVSPGMMSTIKLRVNFTHAFDSLDWATLDISDGKRELSDGDAQMSLFRTKLIESFEIVSGI